VVAQLPPGSIDNLALDKDDRLYVSSTSDGAIVEALSSGGLRTVSGGEFSITMGVAILNGVLFTVHPGALFGFDLDTGERKYVVRSIPGGAGGFLEPTSVTTWNDNLVLMSFPFGALEIYDPFNENLLLSTHFAGPLDAHPFQGDLLVTEAQNGTVVRASGDDLDERQVIFQSAGVGFLAGDDNHVYLTEIVDQTLYQIIQDGKVLDPPAVIATGFVAPEGIVLLPDGETILLVDAGKETLEEVHLQTGDVKTIAADLAFFPGIPGMEFGFVNDVAIDDSGVAYVNGDRSNIIYKIAYGAAAASDDTTSTSAADTMMLDSVPFTLMTVFLLIFSLGC
jgi:hypothetical protein